MYWRRLSSTTTTLRSTPEKVKPSALCSTQRPGPSRRSGPTTSPSKGTVARLRASYVFMRHCVK
jgi:hypothetical protein